VFALGLRYGKERRAFGAPVATHQHNAFTLADLSTRLEAATAFVDACVVAAAKGRLAGADAARAKLLSAQVEHDVLDAVLQLHGGAGYLDGSAAGQAWIDGRVTRIWAGSAEVMRMIVARDLGLEP
jgi:alkylation response protein AidB-like acyl-CoA dehydrogenase